MKNAKSIAVWCTPKVKAAEPEKIELHFNLWKLPNGNGNHLKFLDIGFKIQNPNNIEQLKIYFPFSIEKNDFTDIVPLFVNNPGLLSSIFNANYRATSSASSKFSEITDANNDEFIFDIYQTSSDDLSVNQKFGGTIFGITFPKTNRAIYYRFRISGNYLSSLSEIRKPSNAFLQSAFSRTEMIDFRVNEARDLNNSLLEQIAREQEFVIEKCHFFFVCSYKEDIVGLHQSYLNSRNLEKYRWLDYLGNNNNVDDNQAFLAYHWRIKEAVNDINILIKSKFEQNNWQTIFYYFIGYVLISLTVRLVGNGVFEWLYSFDWVKEFVKSVKSA